MKEYILNQKQIKYLSHSFDLMYDEIKQDIIKLSKDDKNKEKNILFKQENTWLWDQLPAIGRADLNLDMAFKLLTTLITLVYKFHNAKKIIPGNRAEELILHIAIENALEMAEINEVEIDDFDDFIEYVYEDLDFLMMYDPKFDGFDESPDGEMMGIGSLSTKDWFKPYNKPRKPHPFFWNKKERLKFPANKKIQENLGDEIF